MRRYMAKVLLVLTIFMAITPVVFAIQLGDRVLMEGYTGDDIVQLQQILNANGFLVRICRWHLWIHDHRCPSKVSEGKGNNSRWYCRPLKTYRALNVNTSYRGNMGRFSDRDIELIARLVYAEARGEPYSGQVAVAATVLNRLNDPNFPKSITQIIYQVVDGYYQYSPVLDGQINLTPDETARRAVLEALNGVDPSGGATTFFNPSKTSDQWVRSRPYITSIGSHVFSK